jgi:hypothetical protein
VQPHATPSSRRAAAPDVAEPAVTAPSPS